MQAPSNHPPQGLMAQWYQKMVYTPNTSRLTEEGIDTDRKNYEAMLDEFEATLKANPSLANDRGAFNFYPQEPPHFLLSYQHRNNAHLFSRVSDVYRLMFPEVNYKAPHVSRPTKSNSRYTRVAFISGRMSKLSSVMKDRLGVIQKLDRSRFTVSLVTFAQPSDDFGKKAAKSADEVYICEDNDFVKTRNFLASLLFDVVIYCELSFGPRTYALAHSRLAPVQLTTWGHSDTCGISTIDHYISSSLYEVDDVAEAQSHYSENLILHKSLCTYYFRPFDAGVAKRFEPRDHFYLPEKATIYLLIQTPFKIVNEFLLLVADIIKEDPNGFLVMTSHPVDPMPGRNNYKTLQSVLSPEDMMRVRVMPWLKYVEGQNLISVADVLLDSYPFGGCNTTIESLHLGRPTVTLPAKFLYGRFSCGFYKHMGITELIAENFEDYKRIALKLGKDKVYRATVSAKIRAAAQTLFEDETSVREWEETLSDLAPPRLESSRLTDHLSRFFDALRSIGLTKPFLFGSTLLRFERGEPLDNAQTFDCALTFSSLSFDMTALGDALQEALNAKGFVRTTAFACGQTFYFVYSLDRFRFSLVIIDNVSVPPSKPVRQRKGRRTPFEHSTWKVGEWVQNKLVFSLYPDHRVGHLTQVSLEDTEVFVPPSHLSLLETRYGPDWQTKWQPSWNWDPLRSPRNLHFPIVYAFCAFDPSLAQSSCRLLKKMIGEAKTKGDRLRVLIDSTYPLKDLEPWTIRQGLEYFKPFPASIPVAELKKAIEKESETHGAGWALVMFPPILERPEAIFPPDNFVCQAWCS